MHTALSTLSRIFGFDRPVPIPLPPLPRRTAAAPVAKKAKPVSDSAAAISDTLSDELADAREEQRAFRPKKARRPLNVAQAVVVTARVYGDFRADRAWFAGRSNAELDAAARETLDAELHSYCRALYLTGSKTPPVDRRFEFDEAAIRRLEANLRRDCASDIDTWERAMHLVAEMQKREHRAGRAITPSLVIPEAILIAIAARQAERAARLERSRGGRTGTGGGPPVGTASAQGGESSGGGSTLKGGSKKRDDEDDEGSAPPPPAGPRR